MMGSPQRAANIGVPTSPSGPETHDISSPSPGRDRSRDRIPVGSSARWEQQLVIARSLGSPVVGASM